MDASLKEGLSRALADAFPGSRAELEEASAEDRLQGTLVWDGFDESDQLDRQRHLLALLRSKLSPETMSRIGLIFTLTSDEVEAMDSVREPTDVALTRI